MGRTVDYYLAPQSPWAYLGHQRLADIVQRTGATVRVMPIDLGGKVFPISGGLPLGQRAPQRQAYRLVELQRFSQHLNVPLEPQAQVLSGGRRRFGPPDHCRRSGPRPRRP
jgi:2-hydroxychromene-2-carboxylate isomerase